jgi:hypothetical protein
MHRMNIKIAFAALITAGAAFAADTVVTELTTGWGGVDGFNKRDLLTAIAVQHYTGNNFRWV